DVAIRVLRLEHEQLSHHVVRRRVVDLHAEEDDAILEELVVRVLALVAVSRALLELRQDVSAVRDVQTLRDGGAEGGGVHPGSLSFAFGGRQLAVPPPPMTSVADSRMWSTKPYSSA